jgi:hypothetical protein
MFCSCRVEFWKYLRKRPTSSVWVQIAEPARSSNDNSLSRSRTNGGTQSDRSHTLTEEGHPLLLHTLHVGLGVLQGRHQHLPTHDPRTSFSSSGGVCNCVHRASISHPPPDPKTFWSAAGSRARSWRRPLPSTACAGISHRRNHPHGIKSVLSMRPGKIGGSGGTHQSRGTGHVLFALQALEEGAGGLKHRPIVPVEGCLVGGGVPMEVAHS